MSGVTKGHGSQGGLALLDCVPPPPCCSPGITSPATVSFFFFICCSTHVRLACHTTNIWASSPVWWTQRLSTSCLWKSNPGNSLPLCRPCLTIITTIILFQFIHLLIMSSQMSWERTSVAAAALPTRHARSTFLFFVILKSKKKKKLLVSSPFCCLTLHSLIEQHSGTNY